MKLNAWAKKQSFVLSKRLAMLSFICLIPIFTAIVFWIQLGRIEASLESSNNSILVGLQTGDLLALDRAIAAYKDNSIIESFKLVDAQGTAIRQFRYQNGEHFSFSGSKAILNPMTVCFGEESKCLYFLIGHSFCFLLPW